MEKKKLFISMHLPCASIPEAGQKLAFIRLKEIISVHGKDTDFAALYNNREAPYVSAENYNGLNTVKLFRIDNLRRILNLILNYKVPLSIAVKSDYRIKKMAMGNSYQSIHIEYEQGLGCIPSSDYNKCNVVLHDVLSQSLQRFYLGEKNLLKKIIYYYRFRRVLRWEQKIFNRLKTITVLNSKDKELVQSIVNNNTVNIVVDYPRVADFFYSIERDNIEPNSILFWGAMNRKENVDGVLWFVNEVLPIIRQEIPDAIFYIVGANPPEEIISLKLDGIVVTGFVESPLEYFSKAAISIAPLRFGAGIKIKVLETLAAKIPTIATDVGAEGVDNINGSLFIQNDPKKFAETSISLLKS